MDRTEELKNCNLIKVILMLCVVLQHSVTVYMRGGGWGPFEPAQEVPLFGYFAEWLDTFHIFAFAMISGYIFYYQKIEKNRYQQYGEFIKKKAKRLLIPFLFISVIWAGPIHAYLFGAKSIINDFVLGQNPDQLWFLLMSFQVFAVFWPIAEYSDKHPVLGGVFVLGCYAVGVGIGILNVPNYFMFRTALQYQVVFYVGFLIRKYGSEILMNIPSFVYIVIDVALFVLVKFCLAHYSNLFEKALYLGVTLPLNLIGALMAFVLLQKIFSKGLKNNKAIIKISECTMGVYLLHQQITYGCLLLWNGVLPPLILALVSFVVPLTLSYVMAYYINKNRVTKLLIGG